jgi:hypothetical protein
MNSAESGRRTLDAALDGLEHETPDRVSRAIRWLRNPRAKWVRLPIGLLCIAARVDCGWLRRPVASPGPRNSMP